MGLLEAVSPKLMVSQQLLQTVLTERQCIRVVELAKAFDDEVNSVALHPGGLFALVGFADKLRLMAILVDDFRCGFAKMSSCLLQPRQLHKFHTALHLAAD